MAAGTDTLTSDPPAGRAQSRLARFAPPFVLAAIVLLGAFLRFYRLGVYSIGNAYYAAAVKSMLVSWHNFFFVAFEPGGSVTVDKPPLGFWIQAVSAYFLGVDGFALAFPQALAGVLSLPLLYHLVRRHFGDWAGLAAALVLALTPITVATERNNTIDGLLVFVLLLAAWAFLKAAETGLLRLLLLGAFLVGLGFNIKMLQAVLPLPAFCLVYLFGARHTWPRRLLHLFWAGLVFLGVSLAWVAAVDLTPASARPYIGSSTDNTVLELIVGHNGLTRLGLVARGPGGGGSPPAGTQSRPAGPPPGAVAGARRDALPPPYALQPRPDRPPAGSTDRFPPPQGVQPDGPFPGGPGGGASPRGAGGPGGGRNEETGAAGLFRLFSEPLVTEASWLLPFALLGLPLTLAVLGWAWPLRERHLSLLLWAGWLLPAAVYFSFNTGLFHRYYLIMLGPPLAALIGITFWAVWQLWPRSRPWAWPALLVLTGSTLAFQVYILRLYPAYARPVAVLSLLAWLAGLAWLARRSSRNWYSSVGMVLVGLSLLVAPFTWSLLTTLTPNPNVALPTAGVPESDHTRATFMTPDQGSLDACGEVVLAYTLANTKPGAYLLATNNARDAAPFILATGRPVLTFGGFLGSDAIVDLEQFIFMISRGELRFILGLPQGKPEISRYIQQNCSIVEFSALDLSQARPVEVLYDCGN